MGKREVFVLTAISAVALLASVPTLDRIIWVWDDGNNLYGGFAWLHGDIPNISFRHGYPGLMAWIERGLFAAFGFQVLGPKLIAACSTVIVAACAFLIATDLFCIAAGVLAFSGVIVKGYLMFPSPNPGFPMEACFAVGATLVYRFVRKGGSPVASSAQYWLGSFLIGVSLSFKQSGIFGALGLAQASILLVPTRASRSLLFGPAVLLPLAAYLAIRLPTGLAAVPENTIVLVPWVLAVVLYCRYAFRAGPAVGPTLSTKDLAIGLAMWLFGATLWLLLYPDPLRQMGFLVRELYVTVPALIDRDLPPIARTVWLNSLATFGFVLLLFLPLARRRSSPDCPLVKRSQSWFGVATVIVGLAFVPVARLILQQSPVALARRVLRLASPLAWDAYVVPALIGALGLGLLCCDRRVSLRAHEVVLLLVGCTASGALYPYLGNSMYATFALFTCCVSLGLYLRERFRIAGVSIRTPILAAAVLATAIGSFDAGVSFMLTKARQVYERPPAAAIAIRNRPQDEPFIRAAEWLKDRMEERDTVGGYPNYALVFALAGRTSWGRLPNFLGNQSDFDELVRTVADGRGPTFFLASPTNYPAGSTNPYFNSPERLLRALETAYAPVARFRADRGEVRIYRRTIP